MITKGATLGYFYMASPFHDGSCFAGSGITIIWHERFFLFTQLANRYPTDFPQAIT